MPALALKDFPAPRGPLPWTFLVSVSVHAAIALLLLLRLNAVYVPVPVGVEALYVSEARSTASKKAKIRPVAKAFPEGGSAARSKDAAKEEDQVKEGVLAVSSAAPASRQAVAGVKDGAVVSALERYKYELRLFLESRKIYPETAKRLRQTGKVVVRFKISAQGEMSEIDLEHPSGFEILNRAAIALVEGAPRFKPFPSEVSSNEIREMKLSLPIEYIL